MATISISDVIRVASLPIDAQDVVTKANIVIAGTPAGAEPWRRTTYRYSAASTWETREFAWLPVTHSAEDALHATLGAERTFGLPGTTSPFIAPVDLPFEPTAVDQMVNPGSPSAARDGDPTTYAGWSDMSSGASASLVYEHDGTPAPGENLIYGFRLVYEMNINAGQRAAAIPSGAAAHVMLILATTPPSREPDGTDTYPAYRTFFQWDVDETNEGDRREIYALASFDARVAEENNGFPPTLYTRLLFQAVRQPVGGELKIFTFTPLMLDDTYLNSIAGANIRLPATTPQRVTVRGYVAPDREHTIVGWPGGDYTGVVAQVQYELGKTVIDFEQAGAPVGLPAEAIEAARERKVAIDTAVATAAYPVTMGERQ